MSGEKNISEGRHAKEAVRFSNNELVKNSQIEGFSDLPFLHWYLLILSSLPFQEFVRANTKLHNKICHYLERDHPGTENKKDPGG